jgi:DNA-binding NtrC family response regulator
MADRPKILIVDDDPIVAESLAELLAAEGYRTATALDASEAAELLAAAATSPDGPGRPPQPYAVVISDVSLPGASGMELLRRIGRDHPDTVVVMLTGYGTVESAVEALRLGASDYLTKPVVDDELRMSLERALRQQALLAENMLLRRQLDSRFGLENVVGADHRMRRIFDLVEAVAPSRTTVLMTGESGTGKSLIAHAIHQRSPRRTKPFVELSCGSIPETLLESELFGHVKGAFTGAHADKMGRFLAADGGTIFLDEINSASPGMQLKLLRVLQERKFEPVGATQTVEVDVRVVLASNQPLEALVAEGRFRQDLYYRINVVKIELPPLRERTADIPMLAGHFLEKFAGELGRQIVGFTPEAMAAMRRYPFPGNVRELQNVIERAAVLTRGSTISLEDLPPQVSGEGGESSPLVRRLMLGEAVLRDADEEWTPMTLEQALREPEKRILLKALAANAWNRQKTAEQLGINRTTLYKKMKALGIEGRDDERAA